MFSLTEDLQKLRDGKITLHTVDETLARAIDKLKGVDSIIIENERLQEIVNKLPKTEDGVEITDGTVTFCDERCPFPHKWMIRDQYGVSFSDHCKQGNEKHFSTPAAGMDANISSEVEKCDCKYPDPLRTW